MTFNLQENLTLTRSRGGQPEIGGIPGARMSLAIESSGVWASPQVVGTAAGGQVLNLGATVLDGLTYMRVNTEDAIVEIGLKVASVFYPFTEISAELGFVKLGSIPDTSEIWLRSDTSNTEVDVLVHQLDEIETS
jgi:hypothetical protein